MAKAKVDGYLNIYVSIAQFRDKSTEWLTGKSDNTHLNKLQGR